MSELDWDGFLGAGKASKAAAPVSATGSVTTAPEPAKGAPAAASLDWDGFLGSPAANRQIPGSAPILPADSFHPDARASAPASAPQSQGHDNAPPSWWAGADNAVNAFGLNIPRNIGAGVRSMVTGNSFEDEYAKLKGYSERAAQEHPIAAGTGALVGYGAQALLAPELLPAKAALSARAVQGAVTGGALSGASELADSHDVGKALDAAKTGLAVGAIAAPIVEGIGSGVANTISRRFYNPKTVEGLKEEANAAYKTARDAGLVLKGDGVKTLGADIESEIRANGYHPKLQPKVGVVLDEINALGGGNVTLDGLDNLRKIAGTLRMDSDGATRNLGRIAIGKIDDYLANINPGQIAAGKGPEGVKALQEARGLWSTFRKSELIDELIAKARQNAESGNGDFERAVKTQFKQLLQSKSKSAGFTATEKGAIARVIGSSDGSRILNAIGKFAPGSLLGSLAGIAGFANPHAVALNVAGAAAKGMSSAATSRNVERAVNTVRSGKTGDVVGDDAALAVRQFLTSVGVNVDKVSGLPRDKLAEYFPEISY